MIDSFGPRQGPTSELPAVELALQPVVNVADVTVFGYEVLARFFDQQGQPLQTLDTIHALSAHGMIDTLTMSMAEQLVPWIRARDNTSFFVNLTPAQITRDSCDPVLDLLEEADVLQRCFFEITETESMPIDDRVVRVLGKIQERSAGIFLDDFGDGYSTLKRLCELPINGIKLDRSIISSIHYSPRSQVIMEGIADICSRLGCDLIAEGVEAQSGHERVQGAGIQLAQGYWYGKPQAPPHYLDRDDPGQDET